VGPCRTSARDRGDRARSRGGGLSH
jgi:hypothetical protein